MADAPDAAATPSGKPPAPARPPETKLRKFIRETRTLVVVIVVLLAGRSTLADWNEVPTGSMNPTILEGDRIFVNKLAYGLKVPFTTWHLARWDRPQRGQIVVFYAPEDGTRMVKRVIGTPGDKVQLIDNELYVNGQPSTYGPFDPHTVTEIPQVMIDGPAPRPGEPPMAPEFQTETPPGAGPHPVMKLPFRRDTKRNYGPVTVPPGKYLMLGDNRDNSRDSRYWGEVDEDQIVGKATGIAFSFDPTATLKPRWQRF
ncbi:MAG TPA: signal peptidase I, partial [Humisphaera sp.]